MENPKNPSKSKKSFEMMQKKEASNTLREKFSKPITFLAAKIEKNFFYKKWAIFVAA